MLLLVHLPSIRPVNTNCRFMLKVYKIKFYAKGEKLEEWDELAAWCGHVQRFAFHDCLFEWLRNHATYTIRIWEEGKAATTLALDEQSIVRLTESFDVKARLWRLPVVVRLLGISLGHVLVHRYARSTLQDHLE
jgi:hypothetical protein